MIEVLKRGVAKIEQAESATLSSIAKLQEYRQALITAAVTGQLEIPVTEPEEVSV